MMLENGDRHPDSIEMEQVLARRQNSMVSGRILSTRVGTLLLTLSGHTDAHTASEHPEMGRGHAH